MSSDNRERGGCTACCKTHEIPELEKPAGTWCGHCEIGKGCRIYPERPRSCQSFQCLWLRGIGDKENRPDRSKVVISLGSEIGDAIHTITMVETAAGALQRAFARKVTKAFLGQGQVVLHTLMSGERMLLAPEEYRRRFQAETLTWLYEEKVTLQFFTKFDIRFALE